MNKIVIFRMLFSLDGKYNGNIKKGNAISDEEENEMKSKKVWALLLSAAVTAGMLSGCGGSGQDQATGSGSTAQRSSAAEDPVSAVDGSRTEEEPSDGGEAVVLTYWGWDSQFYKPLMDAYTAAHPHVTFEVTDVASTDYVTKLQQTLASGSELPDILVSESSYRGQQVAMDVWEDLTQAPYHVTEDMFFDYTLGMMKNPEGKIVCIDETVCPAVFAYKRDMAKEYLGTDDPDELEAMFSSVEDVIAKAKEVQEKSGGSVYLFPTAGGVNGWLCNLNPISVVNDAGEIIFTEKYTEALQNMCALRDAGGIDIIQQWTPQENASYAESNHIIFPAANWSAEYSIKPNDPDGSGNWGMFTPPGGGYHWGGTAMGISKDSKHKEESWDFIQFCTMTKEGVDLMKEAADYYTPVKEFYDDPAFISNEDPYFGNQDVGKLLYGEVVPNMQIPPSTEYDGVCTEVMTLLLQNIMGDNSYTAKQALADGITEVKNKLPDVVVK